MNFRKNLRSASFYLFLGICLIFVRYSIFSQQKIETAQLVVTPTPTSSLISTYSKVTKVIDGDTIEIEGGEKVRYIGIDAAEVYPTPQCFSDESLAKNRELVLGKVVRLEKDVSETDKYGRLLRYVFVESPSTGSGQTSLFVNDCFVRSGYAKVMTVLPDDKYKDQFLESEKYAEENNLGLWSKCF